MNINELIYIIFEILQDHINTSITINNYPIIETYIINFINKNLSIDQYNFIILLINRLEQLYNDINIHYYDTFESKINEREKCRINLLARKIFKNIKQNVIKKNEKI